jgi:hypothetical protein
MRASWRADRQVNIGGGSLYRPLFSRVWLSRLRSPRPITGAGGVSSLFSGESVRVDVFRASQDGFGKRINAVAL